LISKLACKQ